MIELLVVVEIVFRQWVGCRWCIFSYIRRGNRPSYGKKGSSQGRQLLFSTEPPSQTRQKRRGSEKDLSTTPPCESKLASTIQAPPVQALFRKRYPRHPSRGAGGVVKLRFPSTLERLENGSPPPVGGPCVHASQLVYYPSTVTKFRLPQISEKV